MRKAEDHPLQKSGHFKMDKTEKRWHFHDQEAQSIPVGSIGFLIPGLQKKKLPACCLRVRKSREDPRVCRSQTASKWIKLKSDGIFVISRPAYPPRKHRFFDSGASEKKLPACCLRMRKSREDPRVCRSQTASKWIKLKSDGIFVISRPAYPPRKHRFLIPGLQKKSFPLAAYARA